jgi:dihydrofolate synthase/folylpolyglutamate synthase
LGNRKNGKKTMSLNFLKELKNFEKQRNHNIFQGYSLQEFTDILQFFDLKEKKTNCLRISIVGTNGKGSLAHYLSELAQKNLQLKVGLYTSPHLLQETERIQVNGKKISYSEIQNFLDLQTQEKISQLKKLSYFEFFTFLAIYYFQTQNCNLEIYEAGLGGRLDATKLAQADYVIVTKIGLDHTAILGDTKEKILNEKLEITTPNTKAIFYFPQDETHLNQQILEYGRRKNILTICFDEKFKFKEYLLFNLYYAKFILEQIYQKKIIDLEVSNPKGRMEVLKKEPLVIFDVAHNPDAILHLLTSLEFRYPNTYWDILLGCLADKDILEIYNILDNWKYKKEIFFVVNPNFIIPNIINIKTQQNWSKKNPTLVTGSFRLYELFWNLESKEYET